MHERRVAFTLNLPLKTESEKIKAAVSLITAIIRTKPNVRFERGHFMRIATTFELETVYWVLSDDYDLYMDIQQEILYDIKTAFEGEEISFAYPAQTLQVLPTEVFLRTDDGPAGGVRKNRLDSIVS
jgi:small-conductance mechanosensitive channel